MGSHGYHFVERIRLLDSRFPCEVDCPEEPENRFLVEVENLFLVDRVSLREEEAQAKIVDDVAARQDQDAPFAQRRQPASIDSPCRSRTASYSASSLGTRLAGAGNIETRLAGRCHRGAFGRALRLPAGSEVDATTVQELLRRWS